MKIEEYVPKAIPNNIAELNPLKTGPPKATSAIHTTRVVATVIIVLDKVSLILRLIKSLICFFGCLDVWMFWVGVLFVLGEGNDLILFVMIYTMFVCVCVCVCGY